MCLVRPVSDVSMGRGLHSSQWDVVKQLPRGETRDVAVVHCRSRAARRRTHRPRICNNHRPIPSSPTRTPATARSGPVRRRRRVCLSGSLCLTTGDKLTVVTTVRPSSRLLRHHRRASERHYRTHLVIRSKDQHSHTQSRPVDGLLH